MIITGRQMRGARGLLGWSMEELAEKTDLTRLTIRQIEEDLVQPHEKTLTKILAVFDRQGVEFLTDEGLCIRRQETRNYYGKTGYRQLLDHIYGTMSKGGTIRQFNFSDLRYAPQEESFVNEHLERMASIQGLDARVLEPSGSTEKALSYCSYRVLDRKYRSMAPWYLYGDYLVHSLFEAGGRREFITIYSKLLADRYRKEFEIFWGLSALRSGRKNLDRGGGGHGS